MKSPPQYLLLLGMLVVTAFAYVMVAMLMGGWALNGVYAMLGGWRFLGQLIAYSMPLVMTLTATVMRAESMLPAQIVLSQRGLWNVLYQPVGFALFYLAALALAFLPPFNFPVAAGELAGGVWAEFIGGRLLLFRLGRLLLLLSLALSVTVFYLGGWQGPWLPGFAWTFLNYSIFFRSSALTKCGPNGLIKQKKAIPVTALLLAVRVSAPSHYA